MHKKASRILQMIADNGLDTFDRRTAMRLCRIFHTTAEIQPVLDFLEGTMAISCRCPRNIPDAAGPRSQSMW